MNVSQTRYSLVPQMRSYDQITADYEPYTLFFNRKSFNSNNVNTDINGFRLNYFNNSFKPAHEFSEIDEISIVIGGSTVFGFGSSDDSKSIPSIMTKYSKEIFLNFGATAFNSRQELFLFINNLNKFRKIKQVIIISGVNDLYLGINNKNENNFFFKNTFQLSNDLYKIRNNYYQRLLYLLYKTFQDKFVDPAKINFKDLFISKKKDKLDNLINFGIIEKNYDNIFSVWTSLSNYFKFKLTFCLQPMAGWADKELHENEIKLFKLLDNSDNESHLNLKILSDRLNYKTYLKILQKISNKYNTNFTDLNSDIKSNTNKNNWIFVDRVHLTDLGCEKISKIILDKI